MRYERESTSRIPPTFAVALQNLGPGKHIIPAVALVSGVQGERIDGLDSAKEGMQMSRAYSGVWS